MSAKIVVRSKIVLVAWAKERNLANLQVLHSSIRRRGGEITIVEGHNLITIFTEDEFIDEVKQVIGKRIKLLLRELVKITLLLPEKVTFTPGYAAYMFNLIAARGINMVGDVTSTAEHILIIDEKDLSEALAALKVFSL
jgi:aspartokinase